LDIGPETVWDEALAGVDFVVHLAALAHLTRLEAEKAEGEYHRINVGGTVSLARGVREGATVRRLVFLSSTGAVCSFSDSAISEETPERPDSKYGKSKLVAEEGIRDVLGTEEADWCIVRAPLVYGRGNLGNMERLLRLVQLRLPLPFAGIRNRRSFVFVGNLVNALERCLWHPRAANQTFVIRDGEDVSTPEFIQRIAGVLGRTVRQYPLPVSVLTLLAGLGDWVGALAGRGSGVASYVVHRLSESLWVDDSAIREAIGWEPPFTLDEGLSRTFATEERQP
jgi:nucleoside-diphosphate-sugar epimerase